MASNYPGSLDSLTNPSPTDSELTVSHSAQHTSANDAIEAIQAELGTDPAGSEATVAARLTAIEATGTGDVSGPGSSTDNALVRWDGTGGDTVQNSGVTVDDSGNATVGGDLAVDKTAGSSVLRLDVDNATYSNLIRMSEAGLNRWEILKKTTSRDLGFYSYGAGDYALTLAYADGDATFAADVTVGGVVSVDDTTDTSSGTTGSIHTDGGLGVAKKIYAGTSITAGTDLLAPSGTVTVGGSALIGTASRYTWGNGSTQPGIYQGSGSPESVVSANTGSLYLNSSGGAGTTMYVKESSPTASTGWVAK